MAVSLESSRFAPGRDGAGGRPAVFLDKDGTLLEDVPYNVRPDRMKLTDGAWAALPLLARAGYALVVVSNQSGVARGIFPVEALERVRVRLAHLFRLAGVSLDGFYFCPHLLEGTVAEYSGPCDCRKPAPGLLVRGAEELGLDLTASWMIGDILDDVEAGNRAGCRTVLVDAGHETEWAWSPHRRPFAIAPDLAVAARIVRGEAPRWPALAWAA